jgi:hypothetical protein
MLATQHLAGERIGRQPRDAAEEVDVGSRAMARAVRRVKAVHMWRQPRAAFGELVLWDSSPYPLVEDYGPASHPILILGDATNRFWGRFAEHDSTQENLRILEGWLERRGRPLPYYTDEDSLFVINRPAQRGDELPRRTADADRATPGRVGHRMDRGPESAGQGDIENPFGTLQDRLVEGGASGRRAELGPGQRFPATRLCAPVGAALRRGAAFPSQRAPVAGGWGGNTGWSKFSASACRTPWPMPTRCAGKGNAGASPATRRARRRAGTGSWSGG